MVYKVTVNQLKLAKITQTIPLVLSLPEVYGVANTLNTVQQKQALEIYFDC